MATPLTDSINALTQYANETTGKQDTTLSDAVGSLVEGYGGSDEYITLPDSSLTNSKNFDTYFSALIDGWNTEPILIWLDEDYEYVNELIGGYSAYMQTGKYQGAFLTIWRYYNSKIQSISRNDWALRTVAGKKYKVIRLYNHDK